MLQFIEIFVKNNGWNVADMYHIDMYIICLGLQKVCYCDFNASLWCSIYNNTLIRILVGTRVEYGSLVVIADNFFDAKFFVTQI